jgi:phosphatidylserine decarboxylase
MKINFNLNDLKVRLQYILPKKILTRVVGLAASAKLGKLTTGAIEQFVRIYKINTEEIDGNLADYQTFNDFFARSLKPGMRPIDDSAQSVVFPADGRISQFGALKDNLQIQAKGHYFTTDALLGDEKDAACFADGSFITVYLSPSDYHRVHIPFAGKLKKMTYIPGELFSVNPLYTQRIPELFSRNERVVCLFDTALGKMAVILVGAAIVRSIETVWAGVVAPNKSSEIVTTTYENEDISFAKGDEIGKFMMGSTVICLFEKNKIQFADLVPESHVLVGQKMAQTK